jgi:hypothetical protein
VSASSQVPVRQTEAKRWQERLGAWFLGSVGCALALTALAKIVAVAGHQPILDQKDVVVPALNLSAMLSVAALLEIVVAASIWTAKDRRTAALWVLWLGSLFATYRWARWAMGYREPCRCLGGLFGFVDISSRLADRAAAALLVYMFVGSLLIVGMTASEGRNGRRWRDSATTNSQHVTQT